MERPLATRPLLRMQGQASQTQSQRAATPGWAHLAAGAGLHMALREPVLAVEAGCVTLAPLHVDLPPQQAGGWRAVLGLQSPPPLVVIAVACLQGRQPLSGLHVCSSAWACTAQDLVYGGPAEPSL